MPIKEDFREATQPTEDLRLLYTTALIVNVVGGAIFVPAARGWFRKNNPTDDTTTINLKAYGSVMTISAGLFACFQLSYTGFSFEDLFKGLFVGGVSAGVGGLITDSGAAIARACR